MQKSGWRKWCFALTGVGWLISGYLILRIISLTKSSVPPSGDVCSMVFGAGCDSTLMSPSSYQLGIPLAGWGLLYFAILAMFMTLGSSKMTQAALLLGAAGAGASLAMTGWLILDYHQACPLCFAVHATNFLLLAALWKISRLVPTATIQCLTAGAVIVGVLIQAAFLITSDRSAGINFERVLAAYKSSDSVEIPIDARNPILGSANAAVEMIVFSSFQCPGCQAFARITKQLNQDFPNRLRIVFKHYPLSTICNPALKFDMQPRACAAAFASQAAQHQGKFWPYNDSLFYTDLSVGEETLLHIARETGLNADMFETDRQSEDVRAEVRADVELGNTLGVDATPSVFINGKRVHEFNYAVLKALIDYVLESHAVRQFQIRAQYKGNTVKALVLKDGANQEVGTF